MNKLNFNLRFASTMLSAVVVLGVLPTVALASPDLATQIPTFYAPDPGTYTTAVRLHYHLPEDALTGSVKITFARVGQSDIIYYFAEDADVDFTINPTDTADAVMAANSSIITNISSGSTRALPDGTYTATLSYQDWFGNDAAEVSTGNVVIDNAVPVITLLGASAVTLTIGDTYTDAGATATDAVQGSLTSSIVTHNPVDNSTLGEYTITYNVTDTAGHAATQVTRTVTVVPVVEEVIIEEPVIEEPDVTVTATTDGQTLNVYTGDTLSDQATIGKKTLHSNFYAVVTQSIYHNYQNVVVVRTTKTEAKVIVFRLSPQHLLTHKVVKTFPIQQRGNIQVDFRSALKKVIIDVGNTKVTHQVYTLNKLGRLLASE